MDANSVLRIRDLRIAAGHGPHAPVILNGISLDIAAGETLCLVG